MTRLSLGPRDQRRWVVFSAVVMLAVVFIDAVTGDRFDAPVGGVIVGPMIAAIVCSPPVVALVAGLAVLVRLVIDLTHPDVTSGETAFNFFMVTFLSAIAVVAAVVRTRRERELEIALPAQRLTSVSAALAAARSVDDVKDAFARMARTDLGATWVRFVLVRGESDVAADADAAYVAPLTGAGGELGRVEVWFDGPPDAATVSLLDQAAAQVSVALGRAESARSLAVTARRLSALQRSTSQLAGLLRTSDIARSMVVEVRHALQADRAIFSIVEDDIVRVLATDGATTTRARTTRCRSRRAPRSRTRSAPARSSSTSRIRRPRRSTDRTRPAQTASTTPTSWRRSSRPMRS